MMIINYIMLSKTSAYLKSYNGETKCMWFMIEDNELLKKHNISIKLAKVKKKNLIGNLPTIKIV